MPQRFPWLTTFLLAFGFFGISLIWPIFNTYVPLILAEWGLGATLIGFILTWDNYFNIFIQPLAGALSDRTRTRWGRRKPWFIGAAPLAALGFAALPWAPTVAAVMGLIGVTNFLLALFRAPVVALLGDLFPPEQRSQANGIINFMGGAGAILAFLVGGALYEWGQARYGHAVAYGLPFAFGAGMLVFSIVMVALFIHEPPPPEDPPTPSHSPWWTRVRRSLQDISSGLGRLLLALFSWFWAYSILEAWISSFGRFTLGLSPGRVSLATSVLPLAFVATAIPAGWLGARLGRRRTILLGLAGLAVLLPLGMALQNAGQMMALLALLGAFWALVNVNSLPLVYDYGSATQTGLLTGLYYVASNLALVLGPPAMGWLLDHAVAKQYAFIFPVAAVGMAAAIVCMLLLPAPEGK